MDVHCFGIKLITFIVQKGTNVLIISSPDMQLKPLEYFGTPIKFSLPVNMVSVIP